MGTLTGIGSLLLVLLLFPRVAFAASALSIEASVSDNSLMVGDILTVEVTAVARQDGEVSIIAPQIDGLSELSRSRSEGTSISWTNAGQSITREVSLHIEYQADKPGQITIPSFVAKLRGLEARSQPATITVHGSAPPPTGPVQAGKVAPPDDAERQLFVRYRVDRNQAYLGQQILMDLEIFAQPGGGFSVEEVGAPPELDGFWREIVDQPKRLNRTTEIIDGRRYDVYRLWRVAVFPLAKGKKQIPPASVTFSTGRSLFSSGRRIRRQTAPVEIEVLALPTEGRPQSFSNSNVGQYSLKASVDHTTVPAGKAVVLRVELTGRGNVKNARLPEVNAIEGFRVFPPTITDQINTSLAGINGTKRAEILLMPLVGGRLEIPSLDLTIFDPEAGEYRRLTTDSIRIAVEGDPSAEAPRTIVPESAEPPPPARIARSSLAPLRFRSRLAKHEPAVWRQPLFLAMLGGPPLLFLFALALEAMIARAKRETPTSLKKAASRRARQRLSEAGKALEQGDAVRAYGELREAILELGTNKMGVALRGLTTEQIDQAMSERGAEEPLRRDLIAELEAADHARFGLGGMRPDLDRWTDLLERLDTWTPKEVAR